MSASGWKTAFLASMHCAAISQIGSIGRAPFTAYMLLDVDLDIMNL